MSAAEAKQDTYTGTMTSSLPVEERKPFDKYQLASMEQAVLSKVWREIRNLLQASLLVFVLILLTEITVRDLRLKSEYLYPILDGSVFALGLLLVGCGYWLAFGVPRYPAGSKSQNSRTSRLSFPRPLVLSLCVFGTTLIFTMTQLTPGAMARVECERGVDGTCNKIMWSRMVSWVLPVILAQVYVLFRIRVR